MSNLIYTPKHLSGSVDGAPIQITASSSPGTIIHTATNVPGQFDEIYLNVIAYTSGTPFAFPFVLEIGGTNQKDRQYQLIDMNKGPFPLLRGHRLSNGLVLRAYCPQYSSATISVYGTVNNIAPAP